MANLTLELESERVRIEKIAADVGLDFYETIFELVTYDELNSIAAYGGFPVRYPHWRFGMEYEHLSKSYQYGLSKIYELVINNDPCYAYLMEGNEFIDQKLVMAHVFGHCDFFKNNQWFSPTNRKMMDEMANHATRVRRYIDRVGIEAVEDFIDQCLSLENLIDRYQPYTHSDVKKEKSGIIHPHAAPGDGKLHVHRDYMDEFINPPEFVQTQHERRIQEQINERGGFPATPERDVLEFLLHFAPLQPWQQDVLSIIRSEAYYFAPQGMTKIMNEGWASYWHSKLMTEKIMGDADIIDFADRHSGTMAMDPMGFNPYKVGIELFRDIKTRWDRGQFGKEWSECADLKERANWDLKTMKGREKIFEIRRSYNDVMFVDEFLTEEFCIKNKMFVYKFNRNTNQYVVDTRDFPAIKQKLLFQLTNFGQPIIKVQDGNFENRGELLLVHSFEGVEMQPDYMQATMKNLYSMWSRPVHIQTVLDEQVRLVTYDGKEYRSVPIEGALPQGEETVAEAK